MIAHSNGYCKCVKLAEYFPGGLVTYLICLKKMKLADSRAKCPSHDFRICKNRVQPFQKSCTRFYYATRNLYFATL